MAFHCVGCVICVICVSCIDCIICIICIIFIICVIISIDEPMVVNGADVIAANIVPATAETPPKELIAALWTVA